MILALLLGSGLYISCLQEPAPAADTPTDAPGLTELLVARADEADPELVRRLANLRTSESLDGLIRFYDGLGSLYMRRIALNALLLYDGVPGAETRALETITDIATLSSETELRETAIEALAELRGGRVQLQAIVSSNAEDAIREQALRLHVAGATPDDAAWYQTIYAAAEPPKRKGKEKDAPEAPLYTPPLQELAFRGLAPSRSSKELLEASESKDVEVRLLALEELARRRDPAVEACAERLFESRMERPDVRLEAARVLLDRRGPKFADALYKAGRRGDVPQELAFGIADLLIAVDDSGLHSAVVRNLKDGQEQEKRLNLRIATRLPDPKVDKALLELSKDKARDVAGDALRAMGLRGNPAFVPRLQEVLDESDSAVLLTAAVESLERIQGADPAWRARLTQLARHPAERVRNAALEALGTTRDAGQLPILVEALGHASWSTRLTAARALERLHTPEAVGALCERIALENGRVASEMADILWRLTAKPFRMDGRQWKRWWQDEGASFRFPSPEDLEQRRRERELHEDRQVSRSFRGVKVESRFFGLRITSHHVAFVVDVSGSMDEHLPGRVRAEAPTRLQIARKELLACMDALEAGTRFNILPFSMSVTPWKESAVECTEESFAEAEAFVDTLGALGGTNLYAGLRKAFEDESLDTIFLLSDGEPSVGPITDPAALREEVKVWNDKRGVVIHCIALGERFPLLQWLAADSGGSYHTYP